LKEKWQNLFKSYKSLRAKLNQSGWGTTTEKSIKDEIIDGKKFNFSMHWKWFEQMEEVLWQRVDVQGALNQTELGKPGLVAESEAMDLVENISSESTELTASASSSSSSSSNDDKKKKTDKKSAADKRTELIIGVMEKISSNQTLSSVNQWQEKKEIIEKDRALQEKVIEEQKNARGEMNVYLGQVSTQLAQMNNHLGMIARSFVKSNQD